MKRTKRTAHSITLEFYSLILWEEDVFLLRMMMNEFILFCCKYVILHNYCQWLYLLDINSSHLADWMSYLLQWQWQWWLCGCSADVHIRFGFISAWLKLDWICLPSLCVATASAFCDLFQVQLCIVLRQMIFRQWISGHHLIERLPLPPTERHKQTQLNWTLHVESGGSWVQSFHPLQHSLQDFYSMKRDIPWDIPESESPRLP